MLTLAQQRQSEGKAEAALNVIESERTWLYRKSFRQIKSVGKVYELEEVIRIHPAGAINL